LPRFARNDIPLIKIGDNPPFPYRMVTFSNVPK
jgi:hypothetical protein